MPKDRANCKRASIEPAS